MQGLVTTERSNLDPAAAPFAKTPRDLDGLTEGASLIEVVKCCLHKADFYDIQQKYFNTRRLSHFTLVMLLEIMLAFICIL